MKYRVIWSLEIDVALLNPGGKGEARHLAVQKVNAMTDEEIVKAIDWSDPVDIVALDDNGNPI